MPENETQYELDENYEPLGIVDAADGSGTTWPEFIEHVNKMDEQVAALTEDRDLLTRTSYEEKLTNKTWVDGKPIYRKAIQFSANATAQTVGSIGQVEFVTSISGVAVDNVEHHFITIPFVSGSVSNWIVSAYVGTYTGDVTIEKSAQVPGVVTGIVVIEYTKASPVS